MNLTVPRNDDAEFLLYIWKIIDLPSIQYEELLYKISFEFLLDSPSKTVDYVKRAIENKYLITDKNLNLSLSKELNEKLQKWQNQRKNEIFTKISSHQESKKQIDDFKDSSGSKFNTLLKFFLEKGIIDRAAMVSSDSIEIITQNKEEGILIAKIAGTKEESYDVKIKSEQQIIQHNCHDFLTRRINNKKFCKHLAKLFLILQKKDEDFAITLLSKIAENTDNWDFSE